MTLHGVGGKTVTIRVPVSGAAHHHTEVDCIVYKRTGEYGEYIRPFDNW